VEYGYFPSVITVYFSANCLHFSRLTWSCGAGKHDPKAGLKGSKLLPAKELKKAPAFPGPTPAICYKKPIYFIAFCSNSSL
jgi:hypothetical protein